jgi:hypothetical protein
MINSRFWTDENTFGFHGKEIEMEMDFDFIDLGEPVNKQTAPFSFNGNSEKKKLKKKCTFLFNLVSTPLVLYLSFITWAFKPAVDATKVG